MILTPRWTSAAPLQVSAAANPIIAAHHVISVLLVTMGTQAAHVSIGRLAGCFVVESGPFFNVCHTFCAACGCSAEGSHYSHCDRLSGQCVCHPGVVGRMCDTCRHGLYGFPSCQGIDAHTSDPSSQSMQTGPERNQNLTCQSPKRLVSGILGSRVTRFFFHC